MSGFELTEGLVYLDGNSLGALPSGVAERMDAVVRREWGEGLIRSWNDAKWMELSQRIAGRIAPLVGVSPGDVHLGDSTSVSLFKTTVAAARLRPDRHVLVVEPTTFPTDGYIIAGVADLMGLELRWCDPADPLASVDEDVALLSLTHVDFRTGAMFDMAAHHRRGARARGALMQWDLCHSAGAVPGRPDRRRRRPRGGLHLQVPQRRPRLPRLPLGRPASTRPRPGSRSPAGWDTSRRSRWPATTSATPGIGAFASGTPPVLALSALEAALSAFDGVSVAVAARAVAGADRPVHRAGRGAPARRLRDRHPARARRGAAARSPCGTTQAYGVVQALIAREVIGDFRDPDIARFGFAPLYNTLDDVRTAVERLEQVMANEEHLDPAYAERNAVT